MLKSYVISITDKISTMWFVGESDTPTEIPIAAWSGDSFHVGRTQMMALGFSEHKSNAKIMTPVNMRSWLKRILEQISYMDIDIKEIRIEQVEEIEK